MAMTDRRGVALDRVLELVVVLGEDMTRSLAAEGLTGSRAHLLWELGRTGPSTQRALADSLGVSARNVTGLVDGLVATRFVTREPHPSDRRATLVTLTQHGMATFAQLDRGQEELAQLLFSSMPARQVDAFVDTLDHVLGRLRDQLPPGPGGTR